MLQAFEVACHERPFFSTAPVLELPLPRQCLVFRAKRLRIDQMDGTVLERVSGAPPTVVGFHAGIKVLC